MGLFLLRSACILFLGVAGLLNGAKLIPVPPAPEVTPAFEQNKGQTSPEILFLSRNPGRNVGITATSVVASPMRGVLSLRGANPTPSVRLPAPLRSVAHYYAGSDMSRWVRDVPRFASFELLDVWPKIDIEYVIRPHAVISRITCRPGCDLNSAQYDVNNVSSVVPGESGGLLVIFRPGHFQVSSYINAPTAKQNGADINAAYVSTGLTSFAFKVDGYDPTLPLVLEFNAASVGASGGASRLSTTTFPGGPTVVAGQVDDKASLGTGYAGGCGVNFEWKVIACTDLIVSRFSAAGELEGVSCIGGRLTDQFVRAHSSKDALWIVGNTESPDFPVTANAFQRIYKGPVGPQRASASELGGDYFASKVDPQTGTLLAATYFGGPDKDSVGPSYLGPGDSLYIAAFQPSGIGGNLPTTAGSIRPTCASKCSGHVVRLDSDLSKAIYSTYLPDTVVDTDLSTDGSLIFVGSSPAGFPVSPNAYRRQPSSDIDGTVARLDATGTKLQYATYLGSFTTFVGADKQGGAWVSTSAINRNALLHLDSTGSKVVSS
ncbi:MAG: hypothetical protein IT168_11475 [Bryobacterales bacterium]|nr:hypothetical protein [Bryobacterales bacterium]